MEKIDYLYPSAIEQIRAAINGEPIPDNTENRDGRIRDARYLAPYAIEQIRNACGGGRSTLLKPTLDLYMYSYEPTAPVAPIYTASAPMQGGCSCVWRRGIVGRSLDWYFNEQVEFMCRFNCNGRRIMGIAGGMPGAERLLLDSIDEDRIPMFLQDGVNDKGLFCAILVVPRDTHPTNTVEPLIEERGYTTSVSLPLYVLSNADSVDEAVTLLRDYTRMEFTEAALSTGYEAHYLIADKAKSMVAEAIDSQWVFVESWDTLSSTKGQEATNFKLSIITGTLPQWGPGVGEGHDFLGDGYEELSSGLERYKIIGDFHPHYTAETTVDDMKDIMDDVKFSTAYTGGWWYSDYVGGDYGINATKEQLLTNHAAIKEWYDDIEGLDATPFLTRPYRSGDCNKAWISRHQCVYDLNGGEMHYRVDEADYWNTKQLYDI